MQRRVAFLSVLALVLVTVANAIAPASMPRSALAFQDASPAAAPALAATPIAPPRATPVPVALPSAVELGLVFPAGIAVTPLAVGAIDQLPPDATLLRLERVTVPAGEDLATRTPTAPELLFGELGTATIVDAFGLSAPLSAGAQATLTAGSGYTLRNTSSGPATLLRLGLGSAASSDPAAQFLLEGQLSTLPAAPARLVLALSTWQPGTDTGSFTAAGPIGLLLNSGTLTITSPSGLEAPLGPGQGLVFPAGVPQRERNTGSNEAQALLVAVAPMGQPIVAAVPTPTPLPTATPEPTAMPSPTSTPEPTATALPTATLLPTATPEPTSTPVPTATPTPTPPPEPVLYEAGPNGGFEAWGSLAGWTVLDGELISDGSNCTTLVAPVDLSNVRDYAVEAEIQVIAAMNDNFGFGVFARWNGGERYWGGYSANSNGLSQYLIAVHSYGTSDVDYETIAESRNAAFDGDWHTYRLAVEKNASRLDVDGSEVARATDNRLLTPGDAGIWCGGALQLGIRSFKIIPLGDTAVDVQPGRSDELTGNERVDQDLLSLLPTASDAPLGLTVSGELQRSSQEVSQAFSNPEEALQFLQEWGWQENAYREFAPPNGESLSPSDLDYARVGIHRFGGVSQSAAAADYIAQDIVAGIGGGGGPGPDIGDGSILLSGQNENGNWVNLIVYQGPYVISISMSSPQGDPSGPAPAMAQAMLGDGALPAPAWYAGSWQGTGTQVDWPEGWPIAIDLAPGAIGDVVGTSDYPSLGCGGALTLMSADAQSVELRESLTHGLDVCVDVGIFVLTPGADGAVQFAWIGEGTDSMASGLLTRGDGASAGSQGEQIAAPPVGAPLAFGAEDWQGGLYRGNGEWYGRPWVAVYGTRSAYPAAALAFSLDAAPTQNATLALTGLDDEFPANARIRIAINDVSIHAGPSLFANWDGNMANQGADAAWAQTTFVIPPGLLLRGVNEISVTNLEPTANVGEPPWVLVGDAVLSFG